ncbi:SlyX family protein [Novilysobacter selenitireducens]|uniref:SlyX family protein n=1 Tax=Novilysobacter selenitireducens TaxID=2872639 RepID=A0ABS7T559_9GAMM|nr:SlyX family protein [Lysobacter selenitireducens]MBZ4038988.1 SlyX family protein [Lysobacter selenitireducens]
MAGDRDYQTLEDRMAELETRLAFQEHEITTLSDALAAARDEEARNALLLHRALEELRQLRLAMSSNPLSADPSSEPPPPHY